MNNAINTNTNKYIQDLIRFCVFNISSVIGYGTKYDSILSLMGNPNYINFKYIGEDRKAELQSMIFSVNDEEDLPADGFFWGLLNSYKKLYYTFNKVDPDPHALTAQIKELARYVYMYGKNDVMLIRNFSDGRIESVMADIKNEDIAVFAPFITSDIINSIHNIIQIYSNKIECKVVDLPTDQIENIAKMINKDVIYKGEGGITYPYAIKPDGYNASFILVPACIIEEKTSSILNMKRELEHVLNHVSYSKLSHFIKGELSSAETFTLWTQNADYFPVYSSSPQKFKMIEGIISKYFNKEISALEESKNRSNTKDGYFANFSAIEELVKQDESINDIYEMIKFGEMFNNWRMPSASKNAFILSKLKELKENNAEFWVFTETVEPNIINSLLDASVDNDKPHTFDIKTKKEALTKAKELVKKADKVIDTANELLKELDQEIKQRKEILKEFEEKEKTMADMESICCYIENYINALSEPEHDLCRYFE